MQRQSVEIFLYGTDSVVTGLQGLNWQSVEDVELISPKKPLDVVPRKALQLYTCLFSLYY